MTQIKQIANNRTVSKFNIHNTIFLVRHGECLSNVTWPMDNYTDEIDVLTEQGKSQIKNLLKYFNQFDVEYKIISSTLTRAKESAQILNTGILKTGGFHKHFICLIYSSQILAPLLQYFTG